MFFEKSFDMISQTRHVEPCVLLVRELVDDNEVVSITVDLDGISSRVLELFDTNSLTN